MMDWRTKITSWSAWSWFISRMTRPPLMNQGPHNTLPYSLHRAYTLLAKRLKSEATFSLSVVLCMTKLEISDRAQREAARRRKSDWGEV